MFRPRACLRRETLRRRRCTRSHVLIGATASVLLPRQRRQRLLAVSLTAINNSTRVADPVSGANPLCHGGVDVLFTSLCLGIIMGWQCIICNLRGESFRTCGSCSQNSFFSFEPSEMIPSEQKRSRILACECFLHRKMNLIKSHKF